MANGNGARLCNICGGGSKAARCKAAPFPGLCCEECYDRWVQPVRLLFGPAPKPQLVSAFRSIAKEARRIMEQKNISAAMREPLSGGCDEPDS